MFKGKNVTVQDMASAREKRVQRRCELLESGFTVVTLSLNIPGPVKDNALLRRAFLEAEERLVECLHPVFYERMEEFTGWEGLYQTRLLPAEAKEEARLIEETHPLGRLFDIDVFSPDGEKLSRLRFRRCFLCEKQAQICARSRAHSLEDLTGAVERCIRDYLLETAKERIAALAEQALLYEVYVTPKPGLVDRKNNGAHRDMDMWTFLKSASALREIFRRCASAGMEAEGEELFRRLRQLGLEGEARMLNATGGVNTHKGALFSIGILAASAGKTVRMAGESAEESDEKPAERKTAFFFKTVRDIAGFFLTKQQAEAGGFGGALYLKKRSGGIRNEVGNAFPSVRRTSLPVYQKALAKGASENDAGVLALLSLLGRAEDTNLVHRSDLADAERIRMAVAAEQPEHMSVKDGLRYSAALDTDFIRRGLSPGGCADLLAVTWLLDKLLEWKF